MAAMNHMRDTADKSQYRTEAELSGAGLTALAVAALIFLALMLRWWLG